MIQNIKKYLLLSTLVVGGGIVSGGWTQDAHAQDVLSYVPNYADRLLQSSDTTENEVRLSAEAVSVLSRPVVIDSHRRYGVARLFAPLVFDTSKLRGLYFPKSDIMKQREHATAHYLADDTDVPAWYHDIERSAVEHKLDQSSWDTAMQLREDFMISRPLLVKLTVADLPQDRLEAAPVDGRTYEGELARGIVVGTPTQSTEVMTVSVDRKYWIQRFEFDAHFAQNQLSPNWHKGGQNSMNLNTRLFYELTYERDRTKWVNNLEYKLGIFTSTDEQKRKLQISEDLLRINSNLGLKATKNWFYTVDLSLRSQVLNSRALDGTLVTRPFAPIIADAGVGMKYDLDKKELWGNPLARLRFSANLAPLSAQMIYSYANDIDKGRVGLLPDQNLLFRLGSSLRSTLIWDFSPFLTWSSRLLYNTSYRHVEAEFENTLSYALTQHLSTKLNISLRFDDSVITDQPKTFGNLLQYNELFSFGFAYKL